MIRFYVSNDSYPELREISSRWERHRTWWRAFGSAFGDRRFLLFVLIEVLLRGGGIGAGVLMEHLLRFDLPGRLSLWAVAGICATITWGVLALSWGGDLMRPHLRRASPTARDACPACGHQLSGQLAQPTDSAAIRCPECGARVPRGLFSPPFEIPGEFLAVRRRGKAASSAPADATGR